MVRVVFLGTPQAAVPTLQLLDRLHEVVLVVTQPDRAKGRSGQPTPPPVKEYALEHGMPVSQPTTAAELRKAVDDRGVLDVGVVVAYGRILPREILEAPVHGILNVHFSLLPRWRGAAPVARALMAGDPMTGVSIMQLDEGLDTGPVLTAQAVDIPDDVDAGGLTEILSRLGARLLVESLIPYIEGELTPAPQRDEGVTYARKLAKADRRIDPHASAPTVVSQVRGLAPRPAATLVIDGETHKILEARLVDIPVDAGAWVKVDGHPIAGLGEGAIELVRLQPPGRGEQSGSDWVNGQRRDVGLIS